MKLTIRYFPEDYIPTALDMTIGRIDGEETTCSISIWDTVCKKNKTKIQ
jgi:hypothetical protein